MLALGAISAAVSILFSGWFTVGFQLFGDQPDRGDYAVASGLYAGGVLWLGIAGLVAWLVAAPRWQRWWCWVSTGLRRDRRPPGRKSSSAPLPDAGAGAGSNVSAGAAGT